MDTSNQINRRITRSMNKEFQSNKRITRSMTKKNSIDTFDINQYNSNEISKINKNKWSYKENGNRCGLWRLNEIPDSELEPLVGFNGPIRFNTNVLHHSNFGDIFNHLLRNSDDNITQKQILNIGKKNQPVTFKQIRNALNNIPSSWYYSGRTFWYEGIKYVHDSESEWDFYVIWGI